MSSGETTTEAGASPSRLARSDEDLLALTGSDLQAAADDIWRLSPGPAL